jgi:stage II sporulation protein AB (anti-sigma F factor)
VEKAKEPLYSTKVDEERAGLGFTIMEVFTDRLDVISSLGRGTTVKMKKKYYAK